MMNRAGSQSGRFHAVRFYESPEALSRIVAGFLGEGLSAGSPAVMLVTPEHAALIEAGLGTMGLDVGRLKAADDLIVADASEALTEFMVDGLPDPHRFRAAMVPLIERACKGRTNFTVRAYGEMVDVLWKLGSTVAAIKLEMLWNELAQSQDFALLCGYAMGSFYKDAAALGQLTALHSHVIPHAGVTAVH
jgi:MEDS: MEthanogen/methylotroph, DcmR Sensory domain